MMKIKEVEQIVGITSANIRFYEKEKLIHPQRNSENNYREYSREDVELLKKIKVLRVLGVSVLEVREILEGQRLLEEVVQERKIQLKKEERHLEELRLACDTILDRGISFAALDSSVLDEKSDVFERRIKEVLSADTTQESLTKKAFNTLIARKLMYAFAASAVICFLFGRHILNMQFEGGEGNLELFLTGQLSFIIMAYIVLIVVSYIALLWTAKTGPLMFFYQLVTAAFGVAFLILCAVVQYFSSMQFTPQETGAFMLCMALFVIVLWMLSGWRDAIFDKCRYVVAVAAVYSVLFIAVFGLTTGKWLFWGICIFVLTEYVALNWCMSHLSGKAYSKYYAIVTATQMVNILGMMLAASGNTSSWRRDGREFH